jgi:hypothetical protein
MGDENFPNFQRDFGDVILGARCFPNLTGLAGLFTRRVKFLEFRRFSLIFASPGIVLRRRYVASVDSING